MKKFLILIGVLVLVFLALYAFRNPIGNGLIAAGERTNTEILKIPLIKAGLWFTTSFQQGVEKNLAKVQETANDPNKREKVLTDTKNFFTTVEEFVVTVWKNPMILVGIIAVFLLFMLVFAKDTLVKWGKAMLKWRNVSFAGIAAAIYWLTTDFTNNATALAPALTIGAIIFALAMFLAGPAMQLFGNFFQQAFSTLAPVAGIALLIFSGLGAIAGWFRMDSFSKFINSLAGGTGFWHGLGKVAAGTYNLGNSLTLQRPLTSSAAIALAVIFICTAYFLFNKTKKNGGVA